MTVWLHQERASLFPYGAPDQKTDGNVHFK